MSANQMKLPLRGLNSAACVFELEHVMRQQEGVIWATVNFAAEEANIVYDSATFDWVGLAKAVSERGYAVVLEETEIASIRSTLPIHGHRLSAKLPWRAWRS